MISRHRIKTCLLFFLVLLVLKPVLASTPTAYSIGSEKLGDERYE